MSADNWTVCPRCRQMHSDSLANKATEIEAAYGKVPVAEFDAMRAAWEEMRGAPVRNTFREDYEIGLDGAEFYVRYSGACVECGLKHKFEHDAIVRIGDEVSA